MKIIHILSALLLVASVLLLSSGVNAGTASTLSPFEQFEGWSIDESGMYTNGKDISDTLERYEILDDILTGINDEELPGFYPCITEINGYSVKDKKVAVLLLKRGHLHIYVLFSNDGSTWKADGYTYQHERDEPEYRLEISADSSGYWLVLKHEANHGTGVSIFDEVWINPDGSIAAQYPLSGWVWFLPENTNRTWAEYVARPYYNGDSVISLDYEINFHFDYKDRFQSVYSPVIREYWAYDLQKSELEFINSDPELPSELNAISDYISGDYSIIERYYRYYAARLDGGIISTLEDWENLME